MPNMEWAIWELRIWELRIADCGLRIADFVVVTASRRRRVSDLNCRVAEHDNLRMRKRRVPPGLRCYRCGSRDITSSGMTKHGKRRFQCHGCRLHFSENAKLPAGPYDYSAEVKNPPPVRRLILELKALAQHVLHRTPTYDDIIELSRKGRAHSLRNYYAVFGSFPNALNAARLRSRWRQQFGETEKKNLLAELRKLRKKLKRPLIAKDVHAARARKEVSPLSHFQAAFETVPRAIRAAGAGRRCEQTREEMIASLRELDARLKRPVGADDIRRISVVGKCSPVYAIRKEFGGIEQARAAAGIAPLGRGRRTARS
jgi:hypothetical protein